MTYCLGMLARDGLVMLSDSRTNAGLDQIATFRKMTIWERPGNRVVILTTAGNLSLGQQVVHFVEAGLPLPGDDDLASATTVRNMFEMAQLIGCAVRHVHALDGSRLEAADPAAFNISVLVGGQIGAERPRLFQVYSAGNFIESSAETPFFQLGETKYGRPILDRVLTCDTPIGHAVKLGLISMDSTLRSNLSVGLPLDLAVLRTGALELDMHKVIGEDDAYFAGIRQSWSSALRNAYLALPDPEW